LQIGKEWEKCVNRGKLCLASLYTNKIRRFLQPLSPKIRIIYFSGIPPFSKTRVGIRQDFFSNHAIKKQNASTSPREDIHKPAEPVIYGQTVNVRKNGFGLGKKNRNHSSVHHLGTIVTLVTPPVKLTLHPPFGMDGKS
jgi:hypothetical protein